MNIRLLSIFICVLICFGCDDDDLVEPQSDCDIIGEEILDLRNGITRTRISFASSGVITIENGFPTINGCVLTIDGSSYNLLQIISFEKSGTNTLSLQFP